MKQPNRDPIRFQRANYVVSNLEESYKFYLEVLGFELTFEKESEPDSYSYDVFSIDTLLPRKRVYIALQSTLQTTLLMPN